jgi:putative ABC transport system permease protein
MEDVAHASGECVERSCEMIKHWLKMVWNRKRINGLIMLEIFISFLVLFAVLTFAAYYLNNYRKPLGYNIDNVWSINVNSRLPDEGYRNVFSNGLRQLELTMHDLPEIESVGWMGAGPYAHSTSINMRKFNGQEIEIEVNRATDDIQKVLRIPVIAGRWFSQEDNALADEKPALAGGSISSSSVVVERKKPIGSIPVVINAAYARLLFGSKDPIGQLPLDSTCRIIGVIHDFRKAGELSRPGYYQISRINPEDTSRNFWGEFYIRLREGTTASFQGKLIKVLEGVEKGWSFDINTVAQARESDLKKQIVPLIAGGVVAAFLLFMVALGLLGVLWQNVSQRTKEIGLRRALGGTAVNVSRQIHGEQFAITTIGLAAGILVVIQFPLLDLIGFIQPGVYITALVVSVILMYALTYLCSIFPGWLAMDIEPAEALHYD